MDFRDFIGGWGPSIAGGFIGFVVLSVIWTVAWKGLALWYAARRGEKGWFIAMMLINTIGILEIIYLFGVAKVHKNEGVSKSATYNPPQPRV